VAPRLGTRRITRTPRFPLNLHRRENKHGNRKTPGADAKVQACGARAIRVQLCGYEDAGDEGDGKALAESEDEGDAGARQAGRGETVSGGEFGVLGLECAC
jgi:hypothetical protein